MINSHGIAFHINGKVQGVGFRPYVWQLAHRFGLKGDVANTAEGVIIHLWQGKEEAVDAKIALFLNALKSECPLLARIDCIESKPYVWEHEPTDFNIIQSNRGKVKTNIIPDAATCPSCLGEISNPNDRRFGYPFTNCTHCGPRFTIVKQIPYDRANTSMAAFAMCPACQAEYDNPANRRFHAQPNACPACGPQVCLCAADGQMLAQQDDADQQALIELLKSAAAPIVLVPLQTSSKEALALSSSIAPNLNEVGLMLPSTPLHHILMQKMQKPLVMTSGNAKGKPPALSNEQALDELQGITDAWLMHDREIVQRADDSVVRLSTTTSSPPRLEMLRRARGYVPDWESRPEAKSIPPEAHSRLVQAIERGLNTPLASSTGRLFDAVAVALGVAPQNLSWEGEAACLLEALAEKSTHMQAQPVLPVSIPLLPPTENDELYVLGMKTFWQQWLNWQAPKADRAYAFHAALAQGFATLAIQAAQAHNTNIIALSGGVMHNRLLRCLLLNALKGYVVFMPSQLPSGDGGIALGQALVAQAKIGLKNQCSDEA